VLVSSEFLRARQTSEILAKVLNLITETHPGIHERDFGCLKGNPYERMGEMMIAGDPEPHTWKPAGGESLDEVRRRAISAMEALRARYPGQEIVIVCHGAVIQAVCAHITGVWSEASVPPNCGIVTIDYDADAWQQPLLSGEWDRIMHPKR
jgi:broad specificity phosphatase PhoE